MAEVEDERRAEDVPYVAVVDVKLVVAPWKVFNILLKERKEEEDVSKDDANVEGERDELENDLCTAGNGEVEPVDEDAGEENRVLQLLVEFDLLCETS